MFCSNCGKEIDDKAVVCLNCGCATNNTEKHKNSNNGCLTGFLIVIVALSFIFFTFSVIAGFLGMSSVNEHVNQQTGQNSSVLYKMIYHE